MSKIVIIIATKLTLFRLENIKTGRDREMLNKANNRDRKRKKTK